MFVNKLEYETLKAVVELQAKMLELQQGQINDLIKLASLTNDRLVYLEMGLDLS